MNDRLIINVGRQFGSGGKLVAMELGRLLGINVYDNELISKAAQVSGFSSEIFLKNDEKRSIFSFSSLFTPNLTGQENCLDDGALFKIQSRVIEDIAAGESAVIVGRCADYILRDRGCTLDIFITSPLAQRKKRVSERMELSLEKAEDIIIRNDRKRETYYNYFTLGNWGVASNYDLCIDSSILGIEGTAKYIIDFARKAGYIG